MMRKEHAYSERFVHSEHTTETISSDCTFFLFLIT